MRLVRRSDLEARIQASSTRFVGSRSLSSRSKVSDVDDADFDEAVYAVYWAAESTSKGRYSGR